jgi:release factor glutamine methyltransferase
MSEPIPSFDDVVVRLRAAGCVFAEDEAELLFDAAGSPHELESMIERRVAGLPLEHIVGWAEFAGLRIAVDPGVFVPRRRTEFVLRHALALVRPGSVVLDLCCGSGALGAALVVATTGGGVTAASDRAAGGAGGFVPFDPPLEVYAADIDPAAVASARRNLPSPGQVFEGDLYAALPERMRGLIDVIVVNAPYVPTDAIATMPPEARLHEARIALDGGSDGLDVQRRVLAGASAWLSPGGRLLIETSERQAPVTAAIMTAAGLHPAIERSDELDATVVIGEAR